MTFRPSLKEVDLLQWGHLEVFPEICGPEMFIFSGPLIRFCWDKFFGCNQTAD